MSAPSKPSDAANELFSAFIASCARQAVKTFARKAAAKHRDQAEEKAMIALEAEQDVTLEGVANELARARSIHGAQAFNSLHEAYGVIKEEVDELWTEIKAKKPDLQKVHDEAIQVAAMAVRLATETRAKIEAQTESAQ